MVLVNYFKTYLCLKLACNAPKHAVRYWSRLAAPMLPLTERTTARTGQHRRCLPPWHMRPLPPLCYPEGAGIEWTSESIDTLIVGMCREKAFTAALEAENQSSKLIDADVIVLPGPFARLPSSTTVVIATRFLPCHKASHGSDYHQVTNYRGAQKTMKQSTIITPLCYTRAFAAKTQYSRFRY